ncbi:MAG: glycosyltransferase, partial [bacterium]|nr:glycosyltransferase [bacterium]
MFPISLIILTRFEKDITRLVEFGHSYFQEILIIVHQKDQAKKPKFDKNLSAKIKVITHNIVDDFAGLRNLAHQKASYDYLFFVDSDEQVIINNRRQFLNLWSNLGADVYLVKRYETFLGRTLKYGESLFHARIVKKKIRWIRRVHETPTVTDGPKVSAFHLVHQPNQSIKSFINKLNYYSSLRSKDLKAAGKKANLINLFVYPVAKFGQNYFLRAGLLDGWPGLFQSFVMAYYSLITQVKLIL